MTRNRGGEVPAHDAQCPTRLPLTVGRGLLVALAATVLVLGCAKPPATTGAQAPPAGAHATRREGHVRVVAEVTAFHPQGMFDDFADGTSAAYDLTVLTVREPADLAGKTVSVMHDTPAPEGSTWRTVGAINAFEVPRDAIGDDAVTVNAASLMPSHSVRGDAVRSAFQAAAREGRLAEGKAIVVAERRGFVVVTFIGKPRTYGGTFHVVYSPRDRRDVGVFVEE